MASVTVFVDDAVLGRFPPVCAYTGGETRRLARVDAHVGGPPGLVWLLLLGGPPGLVLLLVLLVCWRSERLSVKVPYSDGALERDRRRRRVRWVSAGVALSAAAIAVTGGVIVQNVWLGIALVAAVMTFITHALLYFDGIDVDLDASRRWVTIRGVHERFAAAVRVPARVSTDR